MKTYAPFTLTLRVVMTMFIVIVLFGCENDTTPSLFDPNVTSRPDPVVSSVSPPNTAFAGIDILTISGNNFSAAKDENTVYFDDVVGEVLEASSTQLKVKAPNVVKDSIRIKITVFKAERYSNTIFYTLEAAVAELFDFGSAEEPWGIACDANDNVYVSLVSNSVGAGVKKITPDGTLSDYAPRGGETFWSSLKIGAGGVLYGARNVRALFQIPAGGGSPATWAVIPNTAVRISDIDFDRDGNMWAGGNNTDIYRIKPDKSIQAFPFVGNVRSVRIFNDHVYLAGSRESLEKIWRLPIISADELGPEEEYFDFSAAYAGGGNVFAITFAADGDMYIGTNGPEAIAVVHPDKSSEPLYAGLFVPKTFAFAWGTANDLYVTREKSATSSQTILKVNMLKKGAPYYGRGDTD